MVVYWLFRLTIFLTRPLPLWLGYRVAAAVASVCYHFFTKQRRALKENLAWALDTNDPQEAEIVARRAFRNFGKFVIDFIHFPQVKREEVRQRVAFAQWTDLDETIESGRGVLMVTMHFGVWDLGAAVLATYDYPINAIAESFSYPRMRDLIHGSREKLGMKVIPAERVGPGVFRALKRGEMLAMLIDVPAAGQGITVDFMGGQAEVSSAPARLALRTGAWVVPAIVLRDPQRDTIIRPVVDIRSARYEPTGDEERDVRELTQRIMHALEPLVRKHADQWYVFHSLWRESRLAKETPEPASVAHLS
ncbi:MAG: lysophospholipid acyltransferase family protein [Dehalococcoidia bacterium]